MGTSAPAGSNGHTNEHTTDDSVARTSCRKDVRTTLGRPLRQAPHDHSVYTCTDWGGRLTRSHPAAHQNFSDLDAFPVSSIAATHPLPGTSVYAASKAALEASTRVWAVELGPSGITVNAVAHR